MGIESRGPLSEGPAIVLKERGNHMKQLLSLILALSLCLALAACGTAPVPSADETRAGDTTPTASAAG